MATTLIQVFNATESPLELKKSHHWMGQNQAAYPSQIARGSWGTLKHDGNGNRSVGAAVYRGKITGIEYDWLVSWSWDDRARTLKAYTEFQRAGHYDAPPGNWEAVSRNLETSGAYSKGTFSARISSTVSIGHAPPNINASALFVGILTPGA